MLKEFRKYLSPPTADVLTSLAEVEAIKDFTLVGESALSIHLGHRISEDLDFFSWQNELDPVKTELILNKISKVFPLSIINSYTEGLDIRVNGINITFHAYNWEKLKERENLLKSLYVGRLELLTAMKINTLSLRAKFRDYYDLYVIANKKFDIKEIFEISEQYIPGLTKKIFAMQIVYTKDIEEEDIRPLSPKYDVSLNEIRIYFEREVKKII